MGLIYDEKGQTTGETKLGVELKNDLMSDETLNAYIEMAESRHGASYRKLIEGGAKAEDIVTGPKCRTPMVKSGIWKNDNTKYLVFGPKEKLLIIRRDVLCAYYEQQLQGKENKHAMYKGVFKENASNRPNAVNEWAGHANRIDKNENGWFDASMAYILRFDKFQELAEDFGIDGIARVLIADGCDYEKLPPDKEYQIKRDENQYVIDKLKGFASFRGSDGQYHPYVSHDKIENHKDDIDYEEKGIHITYTDNKRYDEYAKMQAYLKKLEDIKYKLIGQRAEAQRKGKDTTEIDNKLETLDITIEKHQEKANKMALSTAVTAFVHMEEKHSDGMLRIPLEGLSAAQGIRDSEADRYIHAVYSSHNSMDKDMTYEFNREELLNAIECSHFKIDKSAGVKYALVPEFRLWELNKNFGCLNNQQESSHVNAVIDLEDSDIRSLLTKEYQMDYGKYYNLDTKTKGAIVLDDQDIDFFDF